MKKKGQKSHAGKYKIPSIRGIETVGQYIYPASSDRTQKRTIDKKKSGREKGGGGGRSRQQEEIILYGCWGFEALLMIDRGISTSPPLRIGARLIYGVDVAATCSSLRT